MFDKGYLSGVVTMMRQWSLLHGRQDQSFFGTVCKGEAQKPKTNQFLIHDTPADLAQCFNVQSLINSA
jgi:hypothetical protein